MANVLLNHRINSSQQYGNLHNGSLDTNHRIPLPSNNEVVKEPPRTGQERIHVPGIESQGRRKCIYLKFKTPQDWNDLYERFTAFGREWRLNGTMEILDFIIDTSISSPYVVKVPAPSYHQGEKPYVQTLELIFDSASRHTLFERKWISFRHRFRAYDTAMSFILAMDLIFGVIPLHFLDYATDDLPSVGSEICSRTQENGRSPANVSENGHPSLEDAVDLSCPKRKAPDQGDETLKENVPKSDVTSTATEPSAVPTLESPDSTSPPHNFPPTSTLSSSSNSGSEVKSTSSRRRKSVPHRRKVTKSNENCTTGWEDEQNDINGPSNSCSQQNISNQLRSTTVLNMKSDVATSGLVEGQNKTSVASGTVFNHEPVSRNETETVFNNVPESGSPDFVSREKVGRSEVPETVRIWDETGTVFSDVATSGFLNSLYRKKAAGRPRNISNYVETSDLQQNPDERTATVVTTDAATSELTNYLGLKINNSEINGHVTGDDGTWSRIIMDEKYDFSTSGSDSVSPIGQDVSNAVVPTEKPVVPENPEQLQNFLIKDLNVVHYLVVVVQSHRVQRQCPENLVVYNVLYKDDQVELYLGCKKSHAYQVDLSYKFVGGDCHVYA